MINETTLSLAQLLWDYHHMHHTLQPADCILTLGSHDTRVAEKAAALYHEGWSSLLIFSGGLGRLTQDDWKVTEAETFKQIAIKNGVPAEAILIEDQSTNTGENILFTQRLLQEHNLVCDSFIVVQKPYMERRSYATFKKHWPEKELIVTSPLIPFDQYATNGISMDKVINIMVGDLQRIKVYPSKGYQIEQDIPTFVWKAFEDLVALGFDKQLIKEY